MDYVTVFGWFCVVFGVAVMVIAGLTIGAEIRLHGVRGEGVWLSAIVALVGALWLYIGLGLVGYL